MIHKVTKNYLLQKDDVGKPRPTTRDLPTNHHSYGHAAMPDKEGVGACRFQLINLLTIFIVLTTWAVHHQTSKQTGDKDFAALNRLALKERATTPRKQYDFRQTVNARLKDPR